MRRSDIISGLFLAVIGLLTIYIVIPTEIAVSEEYGLNPKVFPLSVMWLGTAVALLLVVTRLREAHDPDEKPAQMRPRNWLFIIAISAFLTISCAAFSILGFKIAAPATLALLMAAMGQYRHPIRLVLVTVAVPAVVFFAFEHLFSIQLP